MNESQTQVCENIGAINFKYFLNRFIPDLEKQEAKIYIANYLKMSEPQDGEPIEIRAHVLRTAHLLVMQQPDSTEKMICSINECFEHLMSIYLHNRNLQIKR